MNLSYSTSAPIGPGDADIQVELAREHQPTEEYVRAAPDESGHGFSGRQFLRTAGRHRHPNPEFRAAGADRRSSRRAQSGGNRDFAENLMNQLKFVPGMVDLRIQQPFNYPKLHIDVDRTKASEVGFTQRDVAQNLLISLSGSFQTAPSFWLDPRNGRQLQHRDADAAIPRRFVCRIWRIFRSPTERRQRHAANSGQASHRSAAARKWAWSRTTTFNR